MPMLEKVDAPRIESTQLTGKSVDDIKPIETFTVDELVDIEAMDGPPSIREKARRIRLYMLEHDPVIRAAFDNAIAHETIHYLHGIDMGAHVFHFPRLCQANHNLALEYITHFIPDISELPCEDIKVFLECMAGSNWEGFRLLAQELVDVENVNLVTEILMKTNSLRFLRCFVTSYRWRNKITKSIPEVDGPCRDYLIALRDENMEYAVKNDYVEMLSSVDQAHTKLLGYEGKLGPAMKAYYYSRPIGPTTIKKITGNDVMAARKLYEGGEPTKFNLVAQGSTFQPCDPSPL